MYLKQFKPFQCMFVNNRNEKLKQNGFLLDTA